ncbi:MAG: hypothetical protein MZV49_15430 [Rhodopseudomonas palustris]|nr:hypothetical protein [Rhodopseudomonas palustris]
MPDLMLLDEPESGVDIENISVIAQALKIILEKDKPLPRRTRSAIIITHTGFILDYIKADIAFVIMDGHVLGCGAPGEIFGEIKAHGYKKCTNASLTNTATWFRVTYEYTGFRYGTTHQHRLRLRARRVAENSWSWTTRFSRNRAILVDCM